MTGIVETACKSFPAGGAIAQYLRVKTMAALAVAGLTDQEIGTLETPALAAGQNVAVRLRTAQGTCKMVAAAAITKGAKVYTAAAGKISSTAASTSFLIGEACEAASGDGSVIEVLRMDSAVAVA